jgi:hypothetical protein
MIDILVIAAFITTIASLFAKPFAQAWWRDLNDDERTVQVQNVQNFIEAVKAELKTPPKPKKLKIPIPDDYHGDPAEVGAWCRRMTLYFQSEGIEDETDRITYALGKITKGKENRAQKWADERIKELLSFKTELTDWKSNNADPPTRDELSNFNHPPPFLNFEEMIKDMEHYFVTSETQANAIEKIRSIKQGTRMIEEYWIDFSAWKDLTRYNQIALVGLFRDGLNPGLGRKLVEVARMKDTDPLEEWYETAVEYERAKRSADQAFGARKPQGQNQPQNKPTPRYNPVSNASPSTSNPPPSTSKDPNAMDIDTMRKQGICFNCNKKGHIARNCPEPKKPRTFVNRNIDKGKAPEKTEEIDVASMTNEQLGQYYRDQIMGFQNGRE